MPRPSLSKSLNEFIDSESDESNNKQAIVQIKEMYQDNTNQPEDLDPNKNDNQSILKKRSQINDGGCISNIFGADRTKKEKSNEDITTYSTKQYNSTLDCSNENSAKIKINRKDSDEPVCSEEIGSYTDQMGGNNSEGDYFNREQIKDKEPNMQFCHNKEQSEQNYMKMSSSQRIDSNSDAQNMSSDTSIDQQIKEPNVQLCHNKEEDLFQSNTHESVPSAKPVKDTRNKNLQTHQGQIHSLDPFRDLNGPHQKPLDQTIHNNLPVFPHHSNGSTPPASNTAYVYLKHSLNGSKTNLSITNEGISSSSIAISAVASNSPFTSGKIISCQVEEKKEATQQECEPKRNNNVRSNMSSTFDYTRSNTISLTTNTLSKTAVHSSNSSINTEIGHNSTVVIAPNAEQEPFSDCAKSSFQPEDLQATHNFGEMDCKKDSGRLENSDPAFRQNKRIKNEFDRQNYDQSWFDSKNMESTNEEKFTQSSKKMHNFALMDHESLDNSTKSYLSSLLSRTPLYSPDIIPGYQQISSGLYLAVEEQQLNEVMENIYELVE